jgi:hypothetical protein
MAGTKLDVHWTIGADQAKFYYQGSVHDKFGDISVDTESRFYRNKVPSDVLSQIVRLTQYRLPSCETCRSNKTSCPITGMPAFSAGDDSLVPDGNLKDNSLGFDVDPTDICGSFELPGEMDGENGQYESFPVAMW